MFFWINLLVWPVAMMWRGYVLTILWGWFLTQYAPAPSIYAAIGLVIAFHAFMPSATVLGSLTGVERFVGLWMFPLSLLGFGWVWHWLQWGL